MKPNESMLKLNNEESYKDKFYTPVCCQCLFLERKEKRREEESKKEGKKKTKNNSIKNTINSLEG